MNVYSNRKLNVIDFSMGLRFRDQNNRSPWWFINAFGYYANPTIELFGGEGEGRGWLLYTFFFFKF